MELSSPPARWELSGETILALVRRRRGPIGVLGHGLKPLRGPGILAAQRFDVSPIGRYCELMLLEPARIGARVGWSVTLSVVNDARARSDGRVSLGIPRELGALVWDSNPDGSLLSWGERGIVVRVERHRAAIPLFVGLRVLQHRGDGPVVVPLRLHGLAHRGRVIVEAPADDALASIAGSHAGAVVSGQHLQFRTARHPIGVLHTLAGPLHPPDPGVAGSGVVQSRVA